MHRRSARTLVALASVLLVLTLGSSAALAHGAVDNPDYTKKPPVTPTTQYTNRPPVSQMPLTADRSSAPATSTPPPERSGLPVTGADVAELGLIAVALIGAGGLVLAARRRTVAA